MKAFIVLGLAVASAYARSDDGFSSVSRTEDSHGNYQFNYDITDWDTNRKRWEVSDAHNNRKGGYSITDVDGKVRQLEYVADKGGFRAVIRTNEPGTAPGYSGDALYVREGVKQIITAAQPALQLTGHVIKQKNIAQGYIPAAPVAIPKQVYYQQPVAQPVVQQRPIFYQQPIVQKPVLYQQPIAYQPKPVVYQQPIVKPSLQVYQNMQPFVHVQQRPLVYQQPIVQQVIQPKPIVYQQPIVQPVSYQSYHNVHPVVAAPQPKYIAAPVKPLVQKVAVQPVVLKEKKIIVTPPPAYSGPRRKIQKLIEDPAQSYITPELPALAPKRIPGYNPGLEDFEDDDDTTVAPPLSRSRVAYAPVGRFQGITRKSGSFPPLAGPPSRRARA
ncbi:uncharacterized protein LOC100903743 [Galendromus occidentalis]|uniref:Uncharacterized protein LOC100903743 n=1 Tax=Galendromus occidentalis TaxID=34638 RepID=A0AAJ7L5C5_9ACAR|nr:uncharacterized protein LOC100903743 [Galendromus occidentalis]